MIDITYTSPFRGTLNGIVTNRFGLTDSIPEYAREQLLSMGHKHIMAGEEVFNCIQQASGYVLSINNQVIGFNTSSHADSLWPAGFIACAKGAELGSNQIVVIPSGIASRPRSDWLRVTFTDISSLDEDSDDDDD